MSQVRIAVLTAQAARGLDEDEGLLQDTLQGLGAEVRVVAWDDPQVDYRAFDLALLRSTWDYADRLPQFLAWAAHVDECTRLENPLSLVRWNTDKHYLRELAQALPGEVIPSCFLGPGEDPSPLQSFLAQISTREVVVKPAVGAGSLEVQRHPRGAASILSHVQRLHDLQRDVLVQPYLERVDQEGETALIFLEGVYSHAIRKGPMLRQGGSALTSTAPALFVPEVITSRVPGQDERDLAERVLALLPVRPLYARVDLIRNDEGRPCLLELELCEPSLFLRHHPPAAPRFAASILARMAAST